MNVDIIDTRMPVGLKRHYTNPVRIVGGGRLSFKQDVKFDHSVKIEIDEMEFTEKVDVCKEFESQATVTFLKDAEIGVNTDFGFDEKTASAEYLTRKTNPIYKTKMEKLGRVVFHKQVISKGDMTLGTHTKIAPKSEFSGKYTIILSDSEIGNGTSFDSLTISPFSRIKNQITVKKKMDFGSYGMAGKELKLGESSVIRNCCKIFDDWKIAILLTVGDCNTFGQRGILSGRGTFGDCNEFGDESKLGDHNIWNDNNVFKGGLKIGDKNEFRDNNKLKDGVTIGDDNGFRDNNKIGNRPTIGDRNNFRDNNKIGANATLGSDNVFRDNCKIRTPSTRTGGYTVRDNCEGFKQLRLQAPNTPHGTVDSSGNGGSHTNTMTNSNLEANGHMVISNVGHGDSRDNPANLDKRESIEESTKHKNKEKEKEMKKQKEKEKAKEKEGDQRRDKEEEEEEGKPPNTDNNNNNNTNDKSKSSLEELRNARNDLLNKFDKQLLQTLDLNNLDESIDLVYGVSKKLDTRPFDPLFNGTKIQLVPLLDNRGALIIDLRFPSRVKSSVNSLSFRFNMYDIITTDMLHTFDDIIKYLQGLFCTPRDKGQKLMVLWVKEQNINENGNPLKLQPFNVANPACLNNCLQEVERSDITIFGESGIVKHVSKRLTNVRVIPYDSQIVRGVTAALELYDDGSDQNKCIDWDAKKCITIGLVNNAFIDADTSVESSGYGRVRGSDQYLYSKPSQK